MTKAELNELIEKLIHIRDGYKLLMSDRVALADACNVIEENIDKLDNGHLKTELKVGDEVVIGEHRIIVTLFGNGKVFGFNRENVVMGTDISKIKKTGKHYNEIEKLFDKMEQKK